MTRVVFLGTPAAAAPSLDAAAAHGGVVQVISQPARPVGRKRTLTDPPVAARAHELGLDVAQPASKAELAATLVDCDLAIVVAFGMIITPEVLARPRHGFVNVHFSLLPRWRGAAPVERAIEAGDTVTGVTLIQLDAGLDTGPVIDRWSTAIGGDENAGDLLERLAIGGAELLAARLGDLTAGEVTGTPQTDDGVTYAAMISKEDARLDPAAGSGAFMDKVRAFNPRPGAHLERDGEPFKVWSAGAASGHGAVGSVMIEDGRPFLGTGDGRVELVEVQPFGKRRMDGSAWARGLGGDAGRLT